MREPLTPEQMKDAAFSPWRYVHRWYYVNWWHRIGWWLRQKYDIGPTCKLHEAFLFRLREKLLWDEKGSAETRAQWFSWMFFRWLRTGRWESGYITRSDDNPGGPER
jgi:hypothetical protein